MVCFLWLGSFRPEYTRNSKHYLYHILSRCFNESSTSFPQNPANPMSPFTRPETLTRRRALAGIARPPFGVAAGSRALGDPPEPMKEVPASPENLKRTSIHQEVDFKASPQRIYDALLDSKQFAAFTGRGAEIDPKE